jgi:hypothetical protein
VACRLDECRGEPQSAAVPLTVVMTPLSFVGCRAVKVCVGPGQLGCERRAVDGVIEMAALLHTWDEV